MSLMNVSPECPEEYMGNTLDPKYRRPKTNADHIRSMTDEELAAVLDGFGAYSVCDLVCGGKCYAIASLEKTASQKCREIILAKLQEPYKEKEHGQTIGADAET